MTYETFDIVYVSNEVPVSVYCMNSDMIVPTMPTLYSVTIIITETPTVTEALECYHLNLKLNITVFW